MANNSLDLQDNPNSYELAYRRTLTSKHFYNGKDGQTANMHIGHIHYKDKTTKEWKDIDIKLLPTGAGWEMRKANYEAEIPRYSDEWIKFINAIQVDYLTEENIDLADEIIGMKALGINKVEGQLIQSGMWKDRRIIYEDAYGQDIDLEIIAKGMHLAKEIVIYKKPADLSQDLEFSFELDLDDNFKIKPKKAQIDYQQKKQELAFIEQSRILLEKQGNISQAKQKYQEYLAAVRRWEEIEEREEWDKDMPFETEESIIFEKVRKNWLKNFTLRDANGHAGNIRIRLEKIDGKIILTKVLDKDFLENAKYPVRTDASASYYAASGDGRIYLFNRTTWAAARGGASGTVLTSDFVSQAKKDSSSDWDIQRSYFPFNSSGLLDDCTINWVKLWTYCNSYASADTGDIHAVQSPQDSLTVLDATDYAIADFTSGGSLASASIGTNQYNAITLNETGEGWVSKTGNTYLAILMSEDQSNTAPTGNNYYQGLASENTDTGSDPYLEVDYTEAITTTTTTTSTTTSSSTTTSTSTTSSTSTSSTTTSTTTSSTSSTTTSTSSTSTTTTSTTSTSSSSSTSSSTTSTSSTSSTSSSSTSTTSSTTTGLMSHLKPEVDTFDFKPILDIDVNWKQR